MIAPAAPPGYRSRVANRIWVSTAEALTRLGISRWTLYRRLDDEFVRSVHYRDVSTPSAARATYQFCIEEIESLWGVRPGERPPIK